VSRCQKKASSGLYGAKEDNKRHIHRQSGWAPPPLYPDYSAIHLHQSIFTPDVLPAATLPIYPGLGQAREYAALHTPVAWAHLPRSISQTASRSVQSFFAGLTIITDRPTDRAIGHICAVLPCSLIIPMTLFLVQLSWEKH